MPERHNSPYVNRLTEAGEELKKPRTCLKCGKIFASLGPGNRKCPGCLHREYDASRKIPTNRKRWTASDE